MRHGVRRPPAGTRKSPVCKLPAHACPVRALPAHDVPAPTVPLCGDPADDARRCQDSRGARARACVCAGWRDACRRGDRREPAIDRARAQTDECDRPADGSDRPAQRSRPGKPAQPPLTRAAGRPRARLHRSRGRVRRRLVPLDRRPSHRGCIVLAQARGGLHRRCIPVGKRIDPGEVLLLAEHAVDGSRLTAQQRHRDRPGAAAGRKRTRAAGSRDGEMRGFRPLARGWASPSGRPFQSTAGVPRDAPMGGDMFIGGSLPTTPTRIARWDTPRENFFQRAAFRRPGSPVRRPAALWPCPGHLRRHLWSRFVQQPPQPRSRALGHLAVLRARPAEAAAELLRAHLQRRSGTPGRVAGRGSARAPPAPPSAARNAASRAAPRRRARPRPRFRARPRRPARAPVERRLRGAAPAQRAAAVHDPRGEPQFQRVAQMGRG